MKVKESISIVVPAYNEEKNIKDVVEASLKVLKSVTKKYELLIVDDASTDKTGQIVDRLAKKYKHVRIIHHRMNLHTAGALKTLYQNAKGDLVFYVPADKQILPEELYKFLPAIKRVDIVLGYRYKRADPWYRIVISKAYHLLLRIVFGIKFKDVESSTLWKKEVLRNAKMNAKAAFIHTEIIIQALRKGYRVAEVSITHHPRATGKQTGVRPKEVINILFDIFRFWLNIRRKKFS